LVAIAPLCATPDGSAHHRWRLVQLGFGLWAWRTRWCPSTDIYSDLQKPESHNQQKEYW